MTPLEHFPAKAGSIGIFDSGYGGLTILDAIRQQLPQYDYLYLGDNARAPYGPRSFGVVYEFTCQAVEHLFGCGCHLVVLACNTASAKALRTIQQNDLPRWDVHRRVLGIIRPTAEIIGELTTTRHVGILATEGTIKSDSYRLEIQDIHQLMQADPLIDAVILGCTHYPLLMEKIKAFMPPQVRIIAQGSYVATSLACYLRRHPEVEQLCTKGGSTRYLTTEDASKFNLQAHRFLQQPVEAEHIDF